MPIFGSAKALLGSIDLFCKPISVFASLLVLTVDVEFTETGGSVMSLMVLSSPAMSFLGQ